MTTILDKRKQELEDMILPIGLYPYFPENLYGRKHDMAKILSLADHRPDPHLTGKACCMNCSHEWVAVCPVGTTLLKCPECHCEKGFLRYEVLREGSIWTCGCGNDLFHITPDGCYCPHCGEWQKGFS